MGLLRLVVRKWAAGACPEQFCYAAVSQPCLGQSQAHVNGTLQEMQKAVSLVNLDTAIS
jgi:hypothetical protein